MTWCIHSYRRALSISGAYAGNVIITTSGYNLQTLVLSVIDLAKEYGIEMNHRTFQHTLFPDMTMIIGTIKNCGMASIIVQQQSNAYYDFAGTAIGRDINSITTRRASRAL